MEETVHPILPIRGCLEKIRKLMKGDENVGRGQGNEDGVRAHCAINSRCLSMVVKLLPRLSGTRLVCHCLPSQACHADAVIAEYWLMLPMTYDREGSMGQAPSSALLNRLARLRCSPLTRAHHRMRRLHLVDLDGQTWADLCR